MGVSDVTAVRAETVLGKDEAKERTVARRPSMSSCDGSSEGAIVWKRDGWLRSVAAVSRVFWGIWLNKRDNSSQGH